MGVPDRVQDTDWLELCRRATDALRGILADSPTTARARARGRDARRGRRPHAGDRRRRRGRGVRGARRACTTRGCASPRSARSGGPSTSAIPTRSSWSTRSTARSTPSAGCRTTRSRSPSPTATTMADVFFGYVYDFGPRRGVDRAARQGRVARTGAGCRGRPASAAGTTGGSSCSASSPPTRAGCATPPTRWPSSAYRLRALGTMASTVCQVAAARLDGMVSLRRCRAVDVAAAQLIVREAGGFVAFPWCDDPLGAPLDYPALADRGGADRARRSRSWPASTSFRRPSWSRLPPWSCVIDWKLATTVAEGIAGLKPAPESTAFEHVAGPDRGGRAARLGLHRPARRRAAAPRAASTARSGSRPT